jgi:hypothetical protein
MTVRYRFVRGDDGGWIHASHEILGRLAESCCELAVHVHRVEGTLGGQWHVNTPFKESVIVYHYIPLARLLLDPSQLEK